MGFNNAYVFICYQPFVEIMVKIDSYTDSIAIRHYVYHLV